MITDVINYCLKYQITFDQFFILYCFANGLSSELKEYVENKGEFDMEVLEDLYKKGLVKYEKDKGVIMSSTIKVSKSKFNFYSEDVDEWISDWYDLFPKGVKSGGYFVRTGMRSCKKKMQQFMKDNPQYDKDVIMKATKNYIEEMTQKNYSHMKLAPFFINKEGVSMLQGYCENASDPTNNNQSDDPFVIKA